MQGVWWLSRTIPSLGQPVAVLLFVTLMMRGVISFAATVEWSGVWDTRWRGGGAMIHLTQEGQKVTGEYPLYNGRIEAKVQGRSLVGNWIERTRQGSFSFTMAKDGQTFMGRFDSGEWWTGRRLDSQTIVQFHDLNRSTPREALRAFLIASNNAREGYFDSLGPALESLDFGAAGAALLPGSKIAYARTLFQVLDQLTFNLWSIREPANHATSEIEVALQQPATGKTFVLTFRRQEPGDGNWVIVLPPQATLQAKLAELLEFRGSKLPHRQAYLKLRDPRATMRTFLSEIQHWRAGGRVHVLKTMNLSEIAPAIREQAAELAAYYLQQVLARTGYILWQEIPNDPTSQLPYVHFEHPTGSIVIAPVESPEGRIWQFTPATLASLRALYMATEEMPVVDGLVISGYIAPYFKIREILRAWEPALLSSTGLLENWQWLALVVLSILSMLFAWAIAWLILRFWFGKRPTTHLDRRFKATFLWPLRLFWFGIVWYSIWPFLGLPNALDQFVLTAAAVLLIASGTLLVYNLVGLIGARFYERAVQSAYKEEMLVSLLVGVSKLTVVAAGILLLADALVLPYTSVLAGLGIGGLAMALAARPTLENFLAGFILYADRPVSVGDFCRYGNDIGIVETIGIRSTRIRSLERTLITIPNGQFANLQLENFTLRDRMLFKTVLQLRYETTADQLRYVLAKLRELLLAHPRVMDEPRRVRFIGFGAHSLDLEVFAYVNTSDWGEFLAIREDILLRMIDTVDKSGSGFAFPSQVHYMAQDKGLDAARTKAAEEAVQQWRTQDILPFPEFQSKHLRDLQDTLDYPPAGSPDAVKGQKP